MPNGKLTEHLDEAYSELRSELIAAKLKGEEAVKRLTLNGDEDRIPAGIGAAIAELRRLYEEANRSVERVLVEHLGDGKDPVEMEEGEE